MGRWHRSTTSRVRRVGGVVAGKAVRVVFLPRSTRVMVLLQGTVEVMSIYMRIPRWLLDMAKRQTGRAVGRAAAGMERRAARADAGLGDAGAHIAEVTPAD